MNLGLGIVEISLPKVILTVAREYLVSDSSSRSLMSVTLRVSYWSITLKGVILNFKKEFNAKSYNIVFKI